MNVKELGILLKPGLLYVALYEALSDRFYHWTIISPFFLKSSFLSETYVYGVVLVAYSDKLDLNIEIWLKNRETGKFQ